MKNINDLVYLSHIAQTKKLAKDTRQEKKYHQTALLNKDKTVDEVPEEEVVDELPVVEEENDRRAGNDRRKAQQKRGRYIESRMKKNRRNKKEIFLII